ncbi:magnesium chelatase [Paenibacillus selenitireducens]|uniref:Magnesium chelatase n=1 Tax=Paenibacillus selenitireducens TaxID=1324314 RepID=A0A1T2XEQ6_9BACL|nr:MoxR family ATPase [Paenibacillus selenitireducens]OPA78359.1 magnesium chelatase [Paenibacillus selenitireducens]
MNMNPYMQTISAIRTQLEACILGKSAEIKLLLTAVLAGGHVLVEDVPGTGKTQLIKALARTINGQFRRIQCHPDLLPSDITGVSIFHPGEEQFVFRSGPVFTNILLVDEINRATTKTQSALLEAMEERYVTVDGESYALPHPFMMFATQNPIEFDGTYMLPEAQLDRFMLRISLGYPDAATEASLLFSHQYGQPIDTVQAVTEMETLAQIQAEVRHIHLDQAVGDYLVNIVRKTRDHALTVLGASPRASVSFMQAAKAYAFVQGRDYVIPDDLKELAPHVLAHRITLRPEARIEGLTPYTFMDQVLKQVDVPVRLER